MKERISKLQKEMPEGIGAILVTSPINRRYFTGFPSSAGTLLVTAKKSYLIIDSRYFEAAEKAVGSCKVLLQDKVNEQILKLLRQHKIKTLGIESQQVSVSQLQEYEKAFEGVEIVKDDRVSDLMTRIRTIKSGDELELMRAAQKIADQGFLHILNYIEAGRTELQVAIELEEYCRRHGADKPSFDTILASGPNSSMPHAVPGNREIRTGDFVTLDFGCMVDGYCSDMTRTVAVGAVNPQQKECYETVLSAHLSAMKKVKAGVPCKEVDKVARDIIDASEFKGCFGHGLGHCIGLEVHEPPNCNKTSEAVLEAGMVTSVEPGIYVPGKFGVRIEDCVIVTETGCESLATSPKELIIL